ncbi:MAG: ABC transporter ATP-binding protein [Shimia sp.]|uniref:ABC transporter ATP-binding protein n=1 Tax=Shimia sp. TaxID=1954381 RepID=UPI00405835F6
MSISITDLRFSWPGGTSPILDIAAFALAKGERVLLRGPSGCGKSTLLAALAGVVNIQKGAVEVAGQDMATLPQSQRDKFRGDHIGMIFQNFNLIPWLSARDNVTLPCRFSTCRNNNLTDLPANVAERLLSALDLDGFADIPAGTLSHGQQQRVAAARALIGAPDVILADEPTSALDPASKDRFMALLTSEAARNGAGLLVVSHDPGLEDHFDRVVEMSDINTPKATIC